MSTPKTEDRLTLLESEVAELRALVARLARKQAIPTYLTTAEVAEMLQVSERTVYDWVSEERIPFHKAGNATRFLLSELVEWTSRNDRAKLRAV